MAIEVVGIRVELQKRREAAVGLKDIRSEMDGVADAGHDVADGADDAARGLEKASSHRFARGFSAIGRGVRGVAGFLGRGFVASTKVAAVGVAAVTAAAAGLSVKAIGLSSDARETASAFSTVFGPAARGVQKDLNNLTKRFGLYNPELQDAARQFGVFAKAANIAKDELPGFSTDLVQAGLDLSSFYNTDPGETFQALQSGLSGEAEPLRKFGIFISDASMKAQAATMGLGDELTEQQKVLVRHALIMKSLGDAQGDLARTSAGFANQQRGATGRVKTFLTMLGGPLTTAATGAFRGFNSIAKVGIRLLRKQLPGLEKDAAGLSRRFARWGRQLARDLPGAIDTTKEKWVQLSGRVRDFMRQGGRDELGQLGDNVKDLGPAAAAFGRELPGISDTLSVVNTVTGFLADHTDLLAKAVPYLIAGYIALKASQLAANVVLAASIPLKIAELASNRALTKSNKELVASRSAVTATTAGETVAVGANTTAQNTGILARARAVAGMVAERAAKVAGIAVTGAMAAAQWALNAAMTANPIGLIVIGIAALVAGLVLAYKKSDTFRRIVTGAFDAVKGAALWAFNWIKGHWPLLLAIITGPFGIAVYVIAKNWDRIKAGAAAVKDFIVGKFLDLVGFYRSLPGRITRAAKGMWDGITRGAKGAINLIIDAWNSLDLGIHVSVPGWVPKYGGDSFGVDDIFPDIPRLARGGDVRRGFPYVVGDGGRSELFVPDQPGHVYRSVDDGLDALEPASGRTVIEKNYLVLPDGRVLGEVVREKWRKKDARL